MASSPAASSSAAETMPPCAMPGPPWWRSSKLKYASYSVRPGAAGAAAVARPGSRRIRSRRDMVRRDVQLIRRSRRSRTSPGAAPAGRGRRSRRRGACTRRGAPRRIGCTASCLPAVDHDVPAGLLGVAQQLGADVARRPVEERRPRCRRRRTPPRTVRLVGLVGEDERDHRRPPRCGAPGRVLAAGVAIAADALSSRQRAAAAGDLGEAIHLAGAGAADRREPFPRRRQRQFPPPTVRSGGRDVVCEGQGDDRDEPEVGEEQLDHVGVLDRDDEGLRQENRVRERLRAAGQHVDADDHVGHPGRDGGG